MYVMSNKSGMSRDKVEGIQLKQDAKWSRGNKLKLLKKCRSKTEFKTPVKVFSFRQIKIYCL